MVNAHDVAMVNNMDNTTGSKILSQSATGSCMMI
jgi:hypothetical protein